MTAFRVDVRSLIAFASAVVATACATVSDWRPAPGIAPDIQPALERFAPVVVQQTASAVWDVPAPLDLDGSGTLVDDRHAVPRTADVPFYVSASSDAERLYLYYGLYYAVDWSGSPASPKVDHLGDLEGALVVVARERETVEAVITQAHKRLYLWTRDNGLTLDGDRPVLFSESGGHGLYAFLDRPWRAKGGRRYPRGMQALPDASLRRVALAPVPADVFAVLRPLSDLEPFVVPGAPRFKGLGRGATPPWFWRGGGASAGAIVRDPAALYESMRSSHRDLK